MSYTISDLRFQLTQPAFANPLTTYDIRDDVEGYLKEFNFDRTVQHIRGAIRYTLKPFLEDFNLSAVIELVNEYQDRIQKIEPFKAEILGLTRDNPDYGESQAAVRTIYEHITVIKGLQDEAHYYVNLLKEATEVYDSLIDIITAYIENEEMNPGVFRNTVERNRFAKNVTADLMVFKKRLYQVRTSVQSIEENVLATRMNLLTKTESSIRMLLKVNEQEHQIEHGFSRRRTTNPFEETECYPPNKIIT